MTNACRSISCFSAGLNSVVSSICTFLQMQFSIVFTRPSFVHRSTAPLKSVSMIVASVKSAKSNIVPRRSAPLNLAFRKFAFRRFAPLRFVAHSPAPSRLARSRSPPARSLPDRFAACKSKSRRLTFLPSLAQFRAVRVSSRRCLRISFLRSRRPCSKNRTMPVSRLLARPKNQPRIRSLFIVGSSL